MATAHTTYKKREQESQSALAITKCMPIGPMCGKTASACLSLQLVVCMDKQVSVRMHNE